MLNTDYREIVGIIPYREMIYTGPIDEFFDYRYGKLPYRSVEFKHETLNTPVHQPVAVVNYPNEHLYTRVTEFKYLTGQEHLKLASSTSPWVGRPLLPRTALRECWTLQEKQALADATPGCIS